MDEISLLISDGTHHTPKYVKDGVKFLSVKDVRPFKINYDNPKFITEEEKMKLDRRCAPQVGDALLTKIGATFGFAAIVKKEELFQIFVSLALLRPNKKEITGEFMELILNSKLAYIQFKRYIKGVGVPDLHLEDIRATKIPLPPIEIQEQIVSKFQNYQHSIANYEDKIQNLKEKREEFFEKSIGFKSIENKNKQSFELSIAAFSEARFDPNYYQEEYRGAEETLKKSKYPLQKIGDSLGINKVLENMKDCKEINYVDFSCIDNRSGEIVAKKIQGKEIPSRARQKLERGDLLIASLKGSLKNISVFDQDLRGVIASTGFLLIKNSVKYNTIFLKSLFLNKEVQKVMERRMTGSIMAAISQKEFKNIEIPLPPLADQNKIANQINKYELEILNLRNKIKKEKEQQDKVLDVLF